MSPLIIMVAAFVGVTALIVGIAAMAGMFNTSKAEDRLAVMTRRKGRENEAEGAILDELFPEAKAGLIGIVEAFFHRVGRFGLLFTQSDCPIKPEMFYGLTGGCALMGAMAMIIGHAPVPLYPLGAIGGATCP